MTYMTQRGTSVLLRWRFDGHHQCCTFREPAAVKAIAAKHYIESRHHQVTSAQVYAAIDPDSPGAERTATPLLRDWIEHWITMKIDVASSTHYEYAHTPPADTSPPSYGPASAWSARPAAGSRHNTPHTPR